MEKSVIPSNPVADEVRARDEESLSRIVGWETFSPAQKQVLQVLPWFKTLTAACDYLGYSAKGMQVEGSRNKKLQSAFNSRKDSRIQIARQMGADMLGFALTELKELLTKADAKETTKLGAIKLVFELNNMVKGNQPTGVSNTLVQAENVVMYDGARSANGND